MEPFSKRNNIRKEYSGYGVASKGLRNRILQLYGHPYSGQEFRFGPGNTNWIHEGALSKDLQMHFGRIIPIENFRDDSLTTYDEVFDFIELYYARGIQDLDGHKRLLLYLDIVLAFNNSASVYKFSKEGQVTLRIDEEKAKTTTEVDSILEPYDEAQNLYRETIDGLLKRSKDPKDVVGDIYVVFEDYLKRISQKKVIDDAFQYLSKKFLFHPTQISIFEKIKAYRGDVWGSAHAGNSPKPNESDALWYLDTINDQIKYINRKIKE